MLMVSILYNYHLRAQETIFVPHSLFQKPFLGKAFPEAGCSLAGKVNQAIYETH